MKSCQFSPDSFFTRSIDSYSSSVNVSFNVFMISLFVLQHAAPTMISFENGSDPHGIPPPTTENLQNFSAIWSTRYRCCVFLHTQ